MVFMPGLVWLTAEGFAGDARFDLTVGYGRIVFPYILFMSLSALFSGILNATGRFAVAAAAPVLLNIFVITAMAIGALTGGVVVNWLIWSIPVAGLAQLFLTWRAAAAAGFALRPGRPRWTPEMRSMIVIALPAALASGVMQINLVVGQLVASQYDSAVSWLFAADRLYQLPLGVVGIAVGVVLLPDLSRRLRAGDDAGARGALSRAAEISLALTIPSAVALVVVPLALVTVLFQRGAADVDDSAAIATAVTIYGLGLPAFVLQKILQPLFSPAKTPAAPSTLPSWPWWSMPRWPSGWPPSSAGFPPPSPPPLPVGSCSPVSRSAPAAMAKPHNSMRGFTNVSGACWLLPPQWGFASGRPMSRSSRSLASPGGAA